MPTRMQSNIFRNGVKGRGRKASPARVCNYCGSSGAKKTLLPKIYLHQKCDEEIARRLGW